MPSHFHFKLESRNKVLKDGRKQTERENKTFHDSKGTVDRQGGDGAEYQYHLQEHVWRSRWVRNKKIRHRAGGNQPWSWPGFDLALIRICPTWQWCDSKFCGFEQHNSGQKTWLLFWTELSSLLLWAGQKKKKMCKTCSISNILAWDTINPFLLETPGEGGWCKS